MNNEYHNRRERKKEREEERKEEKMKKVEFGKSSKRWKERKSK